MQLQDVIKRIVEVEETIAVSEPVEMAIARAYPYLPRGGDALDLPCFMNQRQFVSQQLSTGRRHYVYRLQLFIAPANIDPVEYAELADAFEDATLAAFAAQVKMGESALSQNIRGEEGLFQPASIPWNDINYYCLQFLMDVYVSTPILVAAGG